MLEGDWTSGLIGRNFVGYRKGEGNRDPVQDPAGTVLYCVNNTAIPHSGDSSSGKRVVSLTVLGIPKLGWSSAPWTKKKGKAATEKVQTKPLFEVDHYERDSNGEKVIGGVKVYSYVKEGQTDKGQRLDDVFSVVEIGQTLVFNVQDFMFEKKGKDDQTVFPDSPIEPYSVVQVCIG